MSLTAVRESLPSFARPVRWPGWWASGAPGLQPYGEMTQRDWYNPKKNYANFVLFNPSLLQPGPFQGFTAVRGLTGYKSVRARFGPPARILRHGPYAAWIWNNNLLTELPQTGLAR